MARTNPEIERLKWENELLRRESASLRAPPGDYPVDGCGDRSCEVKDPGGGMATNGGCRCDERTLRRALRWYKRHATFLRATIEDMKRDARDAELERAK